MAHTTRENRLFLGNPGTGKSALVNCLVGNQVFHSGVSWGTGLTQDYQRFDTNGVAYMDTPGLADRAIVRQAAEAITTALKQDGVYKLFFMVRLNNGRPVYEDVTTIERVLDSIKSDNVSYSIVINNIGKKQFVVMSKRGSEFELVKTTINGSRYKTNHFCLIPTLDELDEQSDVVIKLPSEVVDFVEHAPICSIAPSDVSPINLENFSQQTEAIREALEKLRRERLVMEQRHQDELEREREQHAKELERLCNSRQPNDSYIAVDVTPTNTYPNAPPAEYEPTDDYILLTPTPKPSVLNAPIIDRLLVLLLIAMLIVIGVCSYRLNDVKG